MKVLTISDSCSNYIGLDRGSKEFIRFLTPRTYGCEFISQKGSLLK